MFWNKHNETRRMYIYDIILFKLVQMKFQKVRSVIAISSIDDFLKP